MNSTDLDARLTSMAAPLSDDLERAASDVAVRAVAERARRRSMRGVRVVLPIVLGSALLLSAGAGTATIAFSHWAGVSMPFENVRNEEPIPLTWTTDAGDVKTCRFWVEFSDPRPDDGERLDAAIRATEWGGIGQRLYDDALITDPVDVDGSSAVSHAFRPVLEAFMARHFPDVPWFYETEGDDGRMIIASGMTCMPIEH